MDKIIFLDFDGVIVTRETRYKSGTSDCIGALVLLVAKTDAKVVVSSTWRYEGILKCREYLESWGFYGEVIDMTRLLYTDCRGDEIKNWIHENHYKGKFVILDDDKDMGEYTNTPNFIHVDLMTGLTLENAIKAIEILNG